MTITSLPLILLFASVGGILAEFRRWWDTRQEPDAPIYLRSIRYWVLTGVMILLCPFIAFMYFGGGPVEGLAVLQIGLSTPVILQTLMSGAPAQIQRGLKIPPRRPAGGQPKSPQIP